MVGGQGLGAQLSCRALLGSDAIAPTVDLRLVCPATSATGCPQSHFSSLLQHSPFGMWDVTHILRTVGFLGHFLWTSCVLGCPTEQQRKFHIWVCLADTSLGLSGVPFLEEVAFHEPPFQNLAVVSEP